MSNRFISTAASSRLQRTVRGGACAALAATLFATSSSIAARALSPKDEALERSEILNIVSSALIAFDNKDYTRFSSLFTPDGTFTVVDPDPQRNIKFGKEEMVKKFSALPGKPGDSRHFTSNLNVTLTDPTHASLRGYYVMMRKNGTGPLTAAEMGGYDSKLIKLNGKWMFEDYHVLHTDLIPQD